MKGVLVAALAWLGCVGCGNAVVGGARATTDAAGETHDTGDALDVSVDDEGTFDAPDGSVIDVGDAPDAPEATSCPGGTLCGTACVDVTIDDAHCGSCTNACSGAVCNVGACRALREGHVVVIGHDHRDDDAIASRLLANAVHLAAGAPVRVLMWDEFADPAAVSGAIEALDAAVAATGRTYARLSVSTVKSFASKLDVASFDVALVLDQSKGDDAQLAGAGTMLRAPLASFVRAGGVVVVLDVSATMPSFLGGAALFSIVKQTSVAGGKLEVVAPKDAVARSLPSTYLAPARSVVLGISDPPEGTVPVVRDPVSGLPVVLHRVVGKKP